MINLRIRLGGPFRLFATWSIECGGSDFEPTGRRYRRRVRIGWLTFDAGEYDERPVGSHAYWHAVYEQHRRIDRERSKSKLVEIN